MPEPRGEVVRGWPGEPGSEVKCKQPRAWPGPPGLRWSTVRAQPACEHSLSPPSCPPAAVSSTHGSASHRRAAGPQPSWWHFCMSQFGTHYLLDCCPGSHRSSSSVQPPELLSMFLHLFMMILRIRRHGNDVESNPKCSTHHAKKHS